MTCDGRLRLTDPGGHAANADGTPVLLILPGATSNAERRAALRENAAGIWPDMPKEPPAPVERLRGRRVIADSTANEEHS